MKIVSIIRIAFAFYLVHMLFSCKKETSCGNCGETNKPPVALAGRDTIIILPQDNVMLDGSSSYDQDGNISEYVWSKIAGPAIFIINNATAAKTIVKNLNPGTYQFELKVKDNGALSASDTVMITVEVPATNRPPMADAGRDTSITLPLNSIPLDGSTSTDPDNNITTYEWTKISGPTSFSIANPNSVQTHATNLTSGTYLFELKVTDAGSLVSKDTVKISLAPVVDREIIFTGMVWINKCYQPTIPGACWINGDSPSYGFYVRDTTNMLPNSPTAILGVWIKMDSSSVWEQVPNNCWNFPDPYPQTNFTYCRNADGIEIYSWFFSWVNLEGRKADVIIRF
jgi:hypothetical protein